ncbi:MAG: TauD/TfdA family dioxygenase [Pseudomonadales bacterium]|nr:TauD/TfdA family dioxygenase [Pseudomonadales bacterium]
MASWQAEIDRALTCRGVTWDASHLRGPAPGDVERHVVQHTEDEETVVILWGRDSAAGVHCHGISHCEFEVLTGAVEESREDDRWHAFGPGEVNACGAGCEHDVRCQQTLAVTVHRYRPPLGDAPDAMFADSVQLGGEMAEALAKLQDDAGTRPWMVVRAGANHRGYGSVHDEVVRRLGTPARVADGFETETPVMRSASKPAGGFPVDSAAGVHSAHAYLEQPPTYVVMTCIDDTGEDELLLSSVGALRTLSGDDVDHLRRPAFRFSDPSAGQSTLSAPRAAVSVDGGRLRMRCGTDVVPVDADAARACRRMHDRIADHASAVKLQRGDVLVVNNRLAAHGWDAPSPVSQHLLTSCVWDQEDLAAVVEGRP